MNHRFLLLALGTIGLSSLFAACSENAVLDATKSDAAVDAKRPAPSDDSTDDEGETDLDVTDGGDPGLMGDDDAGAIDIDGGFDAGAECASLSAPPSVTSKCSSKQIDYLGGAIVPGAYALERVTVRATASACASSFSPNDISSKIEASTDGTNLSFKFVRFSTNAKGTTKISRYDLDVLATDNSLKLTPKAPCVGTATMRDAKYTSAVGEDGKQRLLISFPYGSTGSATYRYVIE